MSFDAIIGQQKAIGFLRRILSSGRIPSALLFLGPADAGKRSTALQLAKALNCRAVPGEGCDQCPTCRKIDAGVHPDVEVIEADGRFIKIDQVRGLAGRLALIPFEASRRVIVIAGAEKMNIQSANAFLKTLEEPPEDTLLVLTAVTVADLLETVVSRCLPVRFAPLGEETVRAVFAGREGVSGEDGLAGEELEFAVSYAQGRLRPGLRNNAGRLMMLRDEMLELLQGIERLPFDEVGEKVDKWSRRDDGEFILETLEAWFHDVALLSAGGGEKRIVNRDRMEALRQWSHRLPGLRADACYRKVLELRSASEVNVNKSLAMEDLWFTVKHNALPLA